MNETFLFTFIHLRRKVRARNRWKQRVFLHHPFQQRTTKKVTKRRSPLLRRILLGTLSRSRKAKRGVRAKAKRERSIKTIKNEVLTNRPQSCARGLRTLQAPQLYIITLRVKSNEETAQPRLCSLFFQVFSRRLFRFLKCFFHVFWSLFFKKSLKSLPLVALVLLTSEQRTPH